MKNEYPEAEELRVKIWKEISESATAGIEQYLSNTTYCIEPIVRMIADFVVGTGSKPQ